MATIIGTPDDDPLRGTSAADRIFGLGGNDHLAGRGGGDLLVGGPGYDGMDGGPGADTMVGGTEDNHFNGGPGVDTVRIEGGGSADRFLVSTGIAFDDPSVHVFADNGSFVGVSLTEVEHLVVHGRGGDDRLVVEDVFGTWVTPVLVGQVEVTGLDRLTFDGGSGDDTLDGSAANGPLTARGGVGDDRLIGGRGDDVLEGGLGSDTLAGGAGKDVFDYDVHPPFVFTSYPAQVPSFESDTILDFAPGRDRIDLSDVEPNQSGAPTAGDDRFTFIGTDPFRTGTGGCQDGFCWGGTLPAQLRYDAGSGEVQANTDYDAPPEIVIRLAGVSAVGAVDFIL